LLPIPAIPTGSPLNVRGIVLDGPGHCPLACPTPKAHG
jgi:hypothetical protein